MRLDPPSSIPNTLDAAVLRRFRRKLLENYTSWCSFLGRKSQVIIRKRSNNNNNISLPDLRRELIYAALYLLIWGESGNLWFMPECLCYIYHHMAMELNDFIDQRLDPNTGSPFLPSIYGECAYLKCIVMPIYQTIKTEVESSLNGTMPHSAWRNYDDLNEFFWSRRCLKKLKWPIDFTSNYFATAEKSKRIKKTGFVEKRTFWNVFGSFDKLWLFVGRGLREGLVNNIKYTLFWIAVLVAKLVFSYFLQIKPLAAPTKALLNLGNMKYTWHEFFASSNKIAVVLIWMPVSLIYFMDMHIWYSYLFFPCWCGYRIVFTFRGD